MEFEDASPSRRKPRWPAISEAREERRRVAPFGLRRPLCKRSNQLEATLRFGDRSLSQIPRRLADCKAVSGLGSPLHKDGGLE